MMTELTSYHGRKSQSDYGTSINHSTMDQPQVIEDHKHDNGGEYLLLSIPDDSHANNTCVICLERERDSIFYPCGHECVCEKCGRQFMK